MGSRSKDLFEGAMKEMLDQRHNPRLQNEAREAPLGSRSLCGIWGVVAMQSSQQDTGLFVTAMLWTHCLKAVLRASKKDPTFAHDLSCILMIDIKLKDVDQEKA